jgi:type VI secretion system secreted protein Hcp
VRAIPAVRWVTNHDPQHRQWLAAGCLSGVVGTARELSSRRPTAHGTIDREGDDTMRRGALKGILTTGVLASSLLVSSNAMAASSMFLKLDGIKGESTDDKHRDQIDVLSWSWGVSNGAAQTRRGTLPRACVQDLSFTKFVDTASADLIMDGMLGDVIATGTLVVQKGTEQPHEYIRLVMKNVTVTSFTTGGSGGEDRLTENVTLHFESMQFQYQKQAENGSPTGPLLTFDVTSANAGCR